MLDQAGLILYPTDTIWGIGCDATNPAAVEKVIRLKKRPTQKSFIVLMADTQMLRQYLSNPIPELEDLIAAQQVPTTIIYEGVIGIADNALAADGSLGVRIPKDDFCVALLKRFRKPILSTSANLTGEVQAEHYDKIPDALKQGVDYVVNWRQADRHSKSASTIFKLQADGRLTKIR